MSLTFRLARADDLEAIIALMHDDALSRSRPGAQSEVTQPARDAFAAIEADPNNEIWLGVQNDEVVATLQLTFIPGLSRGGMWRALVEAVRVRSELRGQKIGEQLMQVAIARAKERGCGLMQLTTDVRRTDAHRFYARLGFEPSHLGMKLQL